MPEGPSIQLTLLPDAWMMCWWVAPSKGVDPIAERVTADPMTEYVSESSPAALTAKDTVPAAWSRMKYPAAAAFPAAPVWRTARHTLLPVPVKVRLNTADCLVVSMFFRTPRPEAKPL